MVVNLHGNLEAAKELIVTPEEDEEDSDSDKELDPDVTEVNIKFIQFLIN